MALQRRSRVPVVERARARGPIAALLAARRQELDLSQNDLADLAGIGRNSVIALEAGRNVSLDVLLAALEVLGLHLVLARGTNTEGVRVADTLARQHGLMPDGGDLEDPDVTKQAGRDD